MSLCLVAIFKNESHILHEWLQHYSYQGVDQFFLIDNGSTDAYQHLIESFPVELIVDNARYQQRNHYNRFLSQVKQYDWVLVCDLDEFVYARNGYTTIKQYLSTVHPSVAQILIPWKVFGSNGLVEPDQPQPPLVIPFFTRRINYDKKDGFQGVIFEGASKYSFTKSIARTEFLQRLDVHCHDTPPSFPRITSDSTNQSKIHPNGAFAEISEAILANSCLHLNHYAIQSYDWFMRIKATRGDVISSASDHVRSTQYFREFDVCSNDIDDLELAQKD